MGGRREGRGGEREGRGKGGTCSKVLGGNRRPWSGVNTGIPVSCSVRYVMLVLVNSTLSILTLSQQMQLCHYIHYNTIALFMNCSLRLTLCLLQA